MYSLIVTAKMNGIDPQAWLADVPRMTNDAVRKSDGEAWLVEICHDVARGVHTPGSLSPTIKDAAALWIKRCNEKRLESTTVSQ